MGSGASVDLSAEQTKPLDLSDVLTPRGESVKAELIRLRTLIKNTEFEPVTAEARDGADGASGEDATDEATPSEVGSETSEDTMTTEEEAAMRKKRRGKLGPGKTRSGRKDSVMSQGMRLSMAQAAGESVNQYMMDTPEEGTASQENSPMPPASRSIKSETAPVAEAEPAAAADTTAADATAADVTATDVAA